MDEKVLTELSMLMKDIRDKLTINSIGMIRGPVADPGPGWGSIRGPIADPGPGWSGMRGPIADPGPDWGGYYHPWRPPIIRRDGDPPVEYLLDKSRIAQLRIKQLESMTQELERQIEMNKLETQLLKEEFKLKK